MLARLLGLAAVGTAAAIGLTIAPVVGYVLDHHRRRTEDPEFFDRLPVLHAAPRAERAA